MIHNLIHDNQGGLIIMFKKKTEKCEKTYIYMQEERKKC